jgi:phosphatidylethanolamine N-methyltransferase
MVTQLLSPSEPKNISDVFVLVILAIHLLLWWALPSTIRPLVIGAIFLSWRAGYNLGIGYLLNIQSHHQMLTRWARISKLFVNPATGKNPRPRLYAFLKREMETKIPKDYDFETAPLEYNTWLVFRRVVDLILMCDFVSYMLFAFACAHQPANEPLWSTMIRWSVGPTLFLFNLWVKLDAHRVVKDFAWYWGDFFFLIDQELTFDGVFEMAPHPMYSIGYAGYYGIAMMAGSIPVLYISIAAHAAQFAFLWLVESPHIERTYNSPPPRRQINEVPRTASGQRPPPARQRTTDSWPTPGDNQPPATHNLVGLQNIDLYRTIDSSVILIEVLIILLTFLSPTNTVTKTLFVLIAAACRIWYSVGLGYLLNRQSTKKKWTRHFLKFGESTWEAWRQWKGTYHMAMVLCYSTFVAAFWKVHELPDDWNSGSGALRLAVGFSLMALQIWVAFSIYDQLGEFGWFYGDFFFDQSPKLTYGGIYRFLNNPERFLGVAGLWGLALITLNKAIIGLAMLSQVLSLAFIQFVERPHMQKLYGRNLRQDAGLVRSLRRSLPPPLRDWQERMDKGLTEGFDIVEDLIEAATAKFAAGYQHIAHDTRVMLHEYPARITITRVDPEIVGLDTKDYAVEFEGETVSDTMDSSMVFANHTAEEDRNKPILLEYGAPIKVTWSAPPGHGKRDWIGLYRAADNTSREITRVSSAGRWIATNPGEFEIASSEIGLLKSDVKSKRRISDASREVECFTGSMLFSGDKLFWTQGVFQFRYHHNGKHNVMAISEPFEVRIPRFNEDGLETDLPANSPQGEVLIRSSIEKTLLPVVQNCFERDPDIAPSTPREAFGGLVERHGKFAKRVVYAVKEMFGIEFAPEVVKADGKVENLAWRIWEAKKVLVCSSTSLGA